MKFRAWDGEKWRTDFTITSDGRLYHLKTECRNYGLSEELGLNVDWKVVRFTGLTDKNGVEIWEADIVKVDSRMGLHQIVYNTYKFCLMCVSDIRPACRIAGQSIRNTLKGSCSEIPLDNNRTEVIGNIYENPELLEDKE